jgi:hypothetical protein
MFYRPGGSDQRVNAQYDCVFSDTIGGATGWLPVNKGYTVSVNVAKAFLTFVNAAQSKVTKVAIAPEVEVVAEIKMGGEADDEAYPIKLWSNEIVSDSLCAQRAGYMRFRVVNINNDGGTSGVSITVQVNRTGENA